MIRVHFEYGTHSEVVAIFEDGEIYLACLDGLIKLASKCGATISEEEVEQTIERLIY